jgi:nitrate reductase NapE
MASHTPADPTLPVPGRSTRAEERRAFLFLTIVMAPMLAVIVVAGYGFAVWIYQLFAGPPTG